MAARQGLFCAYELRLLFVAATALLLAACTPAAPPDLGDTQVSTIFATAGDAPTVVDLEPHVPEGSTLKLLNEPVSATVTAASVSLDHARPVHEAIRLAIMQDESVLETLVVWHAVQPATAPDWPLSVSPNRRYLVDSEGSAVFWTGDSPWGLTVVPNRDDASLYLADRADKKINVVLVRLIDHLFSDRNPGWLNYYREPPFSRRLEGGELDFTSAREEYWRQVDWVLREAYRHGITVLGAASYVGYRLGEQGWADHMIANGGDRMRQYGEWIARRYQDYPNLVWVMGGDWSTHFEGKDVADEVDALAQGIKSIDTSHLMTAHSYRNRSAMDDYDRPWLDVNSSYGGYQTIWQRVALDYQRAPVMPTFLVEGHYGNEHGMTDRRIRAQMYQAMLGGAFGQLYGNAPQWYFSAAVADHFADEAGFDWRENLDSFAARSVPVIANLLEEFAFEELTPDIEHQVMTEGHGRYDDLYAPLIYSPHLAIAYLPEQRPVTIDMTKFAGDVNARWRNAAGGAEEPGRNIDNAKSIDLAPPDAGDWVLILEVQK